MGFFDNLGKLYTMGEEAQQNMDVKGSMANAQSKIDAMNSAMEASAPVAEDPAAAARRVDTTATINAVRQTGMVVNFINVSVDVDLLVMLPGGIPLPVSTSLLVPQINLVRLQPGAQLAVSIDPTNPKSVRVDWTK